MDSGPAAVDRGAVPGDPEEALSSHSSEAAGPVLEDTVSKLTFTKDPTFTMPLCAISCRAALWGYGRIFRQQNTAAKHTNTVEKIDDFWSYSRHGDDLTRTALLLLHYTGLQTAVGGTVAAVIFACLLPLDWTGQQHFAGMLVMLMANCVCFVLVLTCVASRRIFLDFACISQDDEDAKRRGIMSLGHTLKCSDHMLCLWDETYWTRLWCVFECAAYLKLQNDGDASKKLKVLPLPNGFLTWGTFMCISLMVVGMYTSMSFNEERLDKATLRNCVITTVSSSISVGSAVLCLAYGGLTYMRVLMDQRSQFRDFSLRGANCFCCAANHVNPQTGERMVCDRVQIEASVVAWFGCIETFESYVRDTLHAHVHARSFLPYRHCALGGLPWFFCAIGGAIWLWRSGDSMEALYFLSFGTMNAFVSVPLFSRVVFYSFYAFQPKSATRWSLFCAMWRCTAFCGLIQMVFVGMKSFPGLLVGKILWFVFENIVFLGVTAVVYRNDV